MLFFYWILMSFRLKCKLSYVMQALERLTLWRCERMKTKLALCFLCCCLCVAFCVSSVIAADQPKAPITIKLDGAKMAPVTFPHGVHKVDCVTCHHKDAQSPKDCTTCHGKEAKGNAPAAKDAFHTKCQNCHKDAAAKGAKAPTKCTECHKK
jgi:hypothetical protein